MTEPLHIAFDVAVPQRHAFETWTARLSTWWPRSHTVTGRADATIELEPRLGGAIRERLPDGSHHTWGTVTAWEPPVELGYDWHLGRDDQHATRVRIRFLAVSEDRARVEIEHAGWEALGEGAAAWRERNANGWNGLLPHFRDQILEETQ